MILGRVRLTVRAITVCHFHIRSPLQFFEIGNRARMKNYSRAITYVPDDTPVNEGDMLIQRVLGEKYGLGHETGVMGWR